MSPESQTLRKAMVEYMDFFVLQSSHSVENLILEPEETSKGGPLAVIDCCT